MNNFPGVLLEAGLLPGKLSKQYRCGGLCNGFGAGQAVDRLDREDSDLFVDWIVEGAVHDAAEAKCAQ